MLPLTFGIGWVTALVLASVLTCGPVLKGKQEKQGKDLEEYLYQRLRQDNCLKCPKTNFELYVKRVQGRKLLETEFRRRDPKTKQIDLVALAREAELTVHVKTRTLLVHMRFCHVIPGVGAGWFEDRVFPVDLSDFIAEFCK
jgi:hypothetical protein